MTIGNGKQGGTGASCHATAVCPFGSLIQILASNAERCSQWETHHRMSYCCSFAVREGREVLRGVL